MLVQDFLERSARTHPDKTALICGQERHTYAELNDQANRLATGLREFGVLRGDRVGLYLNNCVELVVSIFGTLKAGGVFVSLNRSMKPEKAVSLLADCGAVALIADGGAMEHRMGERLAEILDIRVVSQSGGSSRGEEALTNAGPVQQRDMQPAYGGRYEKQSRPNRTVRQVIVVGGKAYLARNGHTPASDFSNVLQKADGSNALFSSGRKCQTIDLDLACLIYTSGTTGESKGVMCDHSNVVFVTESIIQYLKNSERDIVMNVLPLSFSYGLYQLMAMFAVAGTLVLERSFAFPDVVLEQMAKQRVTGFAGVPTIYSMLLSMDLSKVDLSSLRYITNAAAGLPLDHVQRLRQTFPDTELYLMHGLTEVARTMYLPPDQTDVRPASSGGPIPGTELWIEDETGKRLGSGEIGELVVRGRNVMRGYWNAPEMTAARFRPGPLPGERICYSGDLFRMDDEGYFYFVSRKDDLIKSRGEKVAPREIENVLYRMEGVLEAAVIGVPDPMLGQAVKAFVVAPNRGLSESDVIAHCKASLEEFMVPRVVEFRAELPKTSSGKIRKVDLV